MATFYRNPSQYSPFLQQASQAATRGTQFASRAIETPGIGEIFNKAVDRIDKREEAERQRLRQEEADKQRNILFEQKQTDRIAKEAFRTAEAEGTRVVPGILTEAVKAQPNLIADAQLTPTEQQDAEFFTQEDGTYDFEALRAEGRGDLADKLQRQLDISGAVDSPALQETRVQQLDRIAEDLAGKGIVPSDELVTARRDATTAASLAQAKAEKDARSNLSSVQDKATKVGRDFSKLLDKAVSDKGVGARGFTDKDIAKGQAGITDIVRDAVEGKEVSRDNQNEVTRNAREAYNRMINNGIDPITAQDIIDNSVRASGDKWYTWGGEAFFESDNYKTLEREALRNMASRGRGVFSTTSTNELDFVKQQLDTLEPQLGQARSNLATALLSPEDRQARSAAGLLAPEVAPATVSNDTVTTQNSNAQQETAEPEEFDTNITDKRYPDGTLVQDAIDIRVDDIKQLNSDGYLDNQELVLINPEDGETRTYNKGEVPSNLQASIITPNDYIKRYGRTDKEEAEKALTEARARRAAPTPEVAQLFETINEANKREVVNGIKESMKTSGLGPMSDSSKRQWQFIGEILKQSGEKSIKALEGIYDTYQKYIGMPFADFVKEYGGTGKVGTKN